MRVDDQPLKFSFLPSFLPSTYVTLSITPAFPFLIVLRDRVALINNQNIQTKRNNFHFNKSQNGILFIFFSFVLFVLFNFNLFFFSSFWILNTGHRSLER